MKKIGIVVVLSFMLGACSPVFLAGAAVGGAAVYDQRSLKTIKDDHAISYRTLKKMGEDKEMFEHATIDVTSFNRVVLLAGQAPNEDAKTLAEQITLESPEVKRVYNQIKVKPGISVKQASEDLWLTSFIKSKMVADGELRSGLIKVVTEDGVVYLMGDVSRRQASLATRIAREAKGVKKVVRLFEIEQQ